MNKIFYCFSCLVLLLLSVHTNTLCAISRERNSTPSESKSSVALEPPVFVEYYQYLDRTDIILSFYNPNASTSTEIYRSRTQTSGYELIHTMPPQGSPSDQEYRDSNLKPRTTYYYKLRAVSATEASAFSETFEATTLSDWYAPTLTARAINENTIELKLTDNSYLDYSYEIISNDFYQEISMSDSGRTETFIHHPVNPGSTYNYSVSVMTQEEGYPNYPNVATASVTTPGYTACAGIGSMEEEVWPNIPGYAISSIPVNTFPDHFNELDRFETRINSGDNYGSRVRGYICVPQTGNYTFWISSDDNSELWLSTDEFAVNKRKIASLTGWTLNNEWTKYPTQQSAAISLVAGRVYYIEALHKEAGGDDHLAVGWKLPDGTIERPMPGIRIISFRSRNHAPDVAISNPHTGDNFTAPATIDINTIVSDADGNDRVAKVEFFVNNAKIAEDTSTPYSYRWSNVAAGQYNIMVKATDIDGNVSNPSSVNITVTGAACSGTGSIVQEIWRNQSGPDIETVPFNTKPTNFETYTNFETRQYYGDNYGSRMRGYLCVPVTGSYIFWISSDDRSQLYLSTDDQAANKKLVASVPGYTPFRNYDKYAVQKSVPINLVAGRKYYIEALHKEGSGNDFISVGWQLPNGTLERPIPGNRLIKHEGTMPNQAPNITITSPQPNQNFTSPASIRIAADVNDPDGKITKVQFDVVYGSTSTRLAEFTSPPYEYQWNNVPSGSYQLIVFASDDSNAGTSKILFFSVDKPVACSGTGKIIREIWTGIPGTSVSDIPINSTPNKTVELANFETQNYYANDYGSRIRGYVCAPASGGYTFWIASDDNSELWLSNNDDPANKVKIASVTGATAMLQWNKYSSQQSAIVNLVAGQRYYIEALHKEGGGGDHVAVGWQLPSGTMERPIPGSRLIPFSSSMTAAATESKLVESNLFTSSLEKEQFSIYPNPTTNKEFTVAFSSGVSSGLHGARVMAISATGQTVYDKEINCEDDCETVVVTLDSNVAPGVYLVNVMIGKKRLSKKLQVK